MKKHLKSDKIKVKTSAFVSVFAEATVDKESYGRQKILFNLPFASMNWLKIDLKIIFFFLILALIPSLFWFEPGKIISGGDFSYFGLEIPSELKKNFFTWNDYSYFGLDQSTNLSFLPFWGFFFLIQKIFFLSEIGIEKVIFSFLFVFPAISIFFLAKSLLKDRLAILLAIVFYTFSFYYLVLWHNQVIGLVLIYGFLPLFLNLFIKGINKRKTNYSFLLAFLSIFICLTGANPPSFLGIIFLPLLIYLLWYLFLNFKDKKKIFFALKFSFSLLVLGFLFNLWWILPFFYYTENLDLQPTILQISQTLEKDSQYLGFLNLFRQQGYWGLYWPDYKFDFFSFSFAPLYTEPGLKLGLYGFFFPLFAFLVFLKKDKSDQRKLLFFFGLLGLISLFLSGGSHGQSGILFRWMFENIPGFWIFRSPYYKFFPGYLLSLALLLGFFFQGLRYFCYQKKQTVLFFVSYFLLLACILIYSFPMLNGRVIEEYHKIFPRKEYQELKTWLTNQKENLRVFILPEQLGPYANYFWGYNGADFVHQFLPRSGGIRGAIPFETDRLIAKIYQAVKIQRENPEENDQLTKLIGQTGSRYILQRNDYDYLTPLKHGYRISTPLEIKKILSLQQGIELEKSFGQWDIYRINDKYLYSQIHTDLESGTITWKKINPVKYKIQIENATESYNLILLESYHRGWKAYLKKNEKLENLASQIQEKNEKFLANGFANGWKIKEKGNYEIILEYLPQKLFYLGIVASSLSLVLALFLKNFAKLQITKFN